MPANVIEYDLIDRPVGEENFIWQYDFGQKIQFKNIDLPFSYEVHFANRSVGPAEKQLGDASGVVIPYNVTKTGKPVYFWLYVTGENKSVTIYGNHVPVRARASVPTTEPTPEEQSFIEQALGVINDAMEVVEDIPDMVIDEIEKAIEEGKIKGDPGAVFTPHITDGVMTWTNNGDLPNPDPTDFNQELGLDNYATKQELQGKVDRSDIGIPNGVAQLNASGIIPSDQLPSYVDDVLEFASVSQFPVPGESEKIYISTSNNHQYRWSGTQYVDLSSIDITNFINDNAGIGVTDKVWSANKSATEQNRKADKADTVLDTTLSHGRLQETTVGADSVAYGSNVGASGDQSQAFGYNTRAYDAGSHAEGINTIASGIGSHSEGSETVTSGIASHAEGSETTASGNYAHSEGKETIASETYAHSEGCGTQANGSASHSEGYYSKADAGGSHTEGYYTIAEYPLCHVSGKYNRIYGVTNWEKNKSYTVGKIVKRTPNSDSAVYRCITAHTSGTTFDSSKWENITDQCYLELVGNGTGQLSSVRSNARALDRGGNEYLKGDLYVGCNADSSGGTKVAKITDLPDVSSKLDAPSTPGTLGQVLTSDGEGGQTWQDIPYATDAHTNALFDD